MVVQQMITSISPEKIKNSTVKKYDSGSLILAFACNTKRNKCLNIDISYTKEVVLNYLSGLISGTNLSLL